MIIKADDLLNIPEFEGISADVLQQKLEAVEDLIRSYTNNNFQNRYIRLNGSSDGCLYGFHPFLKVNDTVQITESPNNGLYVIKEIDSDNNTITLDRDLYPVDNNRVTKVEYPAAIIGGVINLLIWDVQNRDKVGIQSETLSRHSVTYFAQDDNNQVLGYPAALLGFLKPYIKARF